MSFLKLKVLPVLLILLLIVGCSSGKSSNEGSTESKEKEISILYVGDQFWLDQAKEFEKETGIKVNFEVIGFQQLHDTMFTLLSGGSDEYDVIHVRDDWAAEFASQGFLEPLDDYITDDMKAEFSEQSLQNLSHDGKLYGVPRYLWLSQLYYNTEIFKQAGITEPPKTWDELIEVSKTIQEKTVVKYALGTSLKEQDAIRPFILNLRAEGGEFWDYEANNSTFKTSEGEKALQRLQNMNTKDKIISPLSFEEMSAQDAFLQGEIAMFIGYPDVPGSANDPEKSKIVGKVGTALMPGSAIPSASIAETGGMGIPANSKNKKEAFEFIKFATSLEQEKKMALSEVARIPANIEALQDEEVIQAYPHFSIVAEQIKYPHGLFKHEKATMISDAVSRQLYQAIKGNMTPKEALDAAEKEVSSINN